MEKRFTLESTDRNPLVIWKCASSELRQIVPSTLPGTCTGSTGVDASCVRLQVPYFSDFRTHKCT